jgi:hypothetical protein
MHALIHPGSQSLLFPEHRTFHQIRLALTILSFYPYSSLPIEGSCPAKSLGTFQ